jgi:peptidoglycan/xylan/chitin deacetylase (PgdA/CDA1 family)
LISFVGSVSALSGAACSMSDPPPAQHEHVHTSKLDLSAPPGFVGTSLPAKTLALTFDDGPGDRAAELSMYLKSQNIRAAFFVCGGRLAATGLPNPNGLTPTAGVGGIMAQIVADGHFVANHTVTHRDLVTEVPNGQRVQELSETDAAIAPYVIPGQFLFRPPYGSYNATVFNTLKVSAMNKYVGPIMWDIGDSNTDYPNRAADWACWQGQLTKSDGSLVNGTGYATTKQCGDAYLAEIASVGRGIVLMHDPYSWASGSTVDMVKYMVPILKAQGYSFVRVDEVPDIAAALPPPLCDATCATCTGPAANQCTSCVGGRYLSGGTCLTCATCASNQYVQTACSGATNTVCANCNATCATCTGAGTNACSSCSAGRWLNGTTCSTCSTCGAGTWQSAACTTTSNTVCSPCTTCSAGTYQTAACGGTSDTACAACNATCATCNGAGSNACTSCSLPRYLSGTSCATCATCPAGKYEATACTPTSNTVCSNCDGTCATCTGAGSNACASCNAGRWLNGTACSLCSSCPAGTYQTAACTTTVDTQCAPCDPSCSNCTGPNPDQCAACPPGSYLAGGSCHTCTVCAAGKYRSAACTATADTVCTSCSPGTYSAASGANACTQCAEGTAAGAAGSTTCAACAPGTYASAKGQTTCSACAAGQSSADAGATACSSCKAGSYAASGSATCTACPAGTASADGAASCTACAPGSYSKGGAATCTKCDPGTFAATAGATSCGACGSCDDGDACTDDSCDAAKGCVHVRKASCGGPAPDGGVSPSGDGGKIDDGNKDSGPVNEDGGCALAPARAGHGDLATFLVGLGAVAFALGRRRRRA